MSEKERVRGRAPAAAVFVLMLLAATGPAWAGAAGGGAPDGGADIFDFSHLHPMLLWWLAPVGSVLALLFAYVFYRQVRSAGEGSEEMQTIAGHVREGAYAYLRRQYKVVAIFFVVVSAVLGLMGLIGAQHQIVFIAFLTGGFFSGLCGFLGMKTATLASNRTAQGAKEGLNRGLTVAFRAGAVMGLVVVGFGLLDISMWFLLLHKVAPLLGYHMTLVEITVVMLTFGMGASSQALFARVGGGIFTKAADVGADLVGKVEAGIPEDDPRNPATIADNVGDNVGDVAGMGADLYESYCGSILATAALGVAAAAALGLGMGDRLRMLAAPMVLAGIGIVLSILGIYVVRTREGASMKQLIGALGLGVNGSSVLIAAVSAGVCYLLLGGIEGVTWWGVWLSILSGLAAGVLIGKSTEYYTSYGYKPTQDISRQSETGPATVIIAGVAEGMKSTWAALATIIVAILCAYSFAGGWDTMPLGLYGVGIAAVGMLATLGITLATDAYGPIADNAGGNAEMTGQESYVRERTDALDSLGNTTAATGKGFAIGSAALTALALLAAYVEEVRIGIDRTADWSYEETAEGRRAYVLDADEEEVPLEGFQDAGHGLFARLEKDETGEAVVAGYFLDHWKSGKDALFGEKVPVLRRSSQARLGDFMKYYNITLMNPRVLIGMFLGAMLAFVFCALTMKAVGRAAAAMVQEVRRQFQVIPGIMEGTGKPEYAKCVAISTAGAQREMIVPSLLALIVPVATGLALGVAGVMGLLAGGLATGFVLAIMMANAGGAWDNAKKFIESGGLREEMYAPAKLVETYKKKKDAVVEDGRLVVTDTGQADRLLDALSRDPDPQKPDALQPVFVVRAKGSENHKAGVVGDTVGDPFKDTSGPSLNILIKLMSMVSVVFAGLTVKFGPEIGALLGMN